VGIATVKITAEVVPRRFCKNDHPAYSVTFAIVISRSAPLYTVPKV
jgi:hypothetical protein